MEKQAKVERVLNGTVVKAKAQKTVTVSVERSFQHPVYKKIIRRKKSYLAHDEAGRCKPGDKVEIKLVRPLSKLKRWLVINVVPAAEGQDKEV